LVRINILSKKSKNSIFTRIFKNREAWYRQLITLDFSQDEAVQYAKLFASNDVELSMIPELSDSILKAIGIEKAGQ
jgi:hypothetical protein